MDKTFRKKNMDNINYLKRNSNKANTRNDLNHKDDVIRLTNIKNMIRNNKNIYFS